MIGRTDHKQGAAIRQCNDEIVGIRRAMRVDDNRSYVIERDATSLPALRGHNHVATIGAEMLAIRRYIDNPVHPPSPTRTIEADNPHSGKSGRQSPI
jgi:hypothetical protein